MYIFNALNVRLLVIKKFFNGEKLGRFYLNRNLTTLKRPKKIIQFGIHLALLIQYVFFDIYT